MTYKNISFFNLRGKAYLFGIVLVCGFLLTSYDDCGGQEQGSQQAATASGSSKTGGSQEGAKTGSTGANYVTSIFGKTWNLTEVRFAERTVVLNRKELKGNQTDIFTMTIDKERISGKGAPNRYFTSYQAGPDNALTLSPVAGTMMASLVFDPERIQESEYFQYLGKVTSWKLNQNKLEFTSTDAADKPLVMIFSP